MEIHRGPKHVQRVLVLPPMMLTGENAAGARRCSVCFQKKAKNYRFGPPSCESCELFFNGTVQELCSTSGQLGPCSSWGVKPQTWHWFAPICLPQRFENCRTCYFGSCMKAKMDPNIVMLLLGKMAPSQFYEEPLVFGAESLPLLFGQESSSATKSRFYRSFNLFKMTKFLNNHQNFKKSLFERLCFVKITSQEFPNSRKIKL